jgi:hypothetical protein
MQMPRSPRFQQNRPLSRRSELVGDLVESVGPPWVVQLDRQHIDVDFDKEGFAAADRLGEGGPANQHVVVADQPYRDVWAVSDCLGERLA